ncbi:MAG: hypothetical protein H0V86_11215 [Chloroflexia bacterium]|nr:hypothetical protein [Chloroflexia bacterium]
MDQAAHKDQGNLRRPTVQVTAQVLGIVAAPLLLAGPTHPRVLTGETAAGYYRGGQVD